jgi:hypothetical protein
MLLNIYTIITYQAAGNDLRASLEYIKCHLGDINFPLETTVDYHGFRVYYHHIVLI